MKKELIVSMLFANALLTPISTMAQIDDGGFPPFDPKVHPHFVPFLKPFVVCLDEEKILTVRFNIDLNSATL